MNLLHEIAAARFWPRVRKTDTCWLWIGHKSRPGYGALNLKGKHVRVHRFSWLLHFGEIPTGMSILHRCDVRNCVNPSHLFLGTQADNMKDAGKKGRICTIGKSRLTECKRGHPFNEENTYRDGKGHRRCNTCRQESDALRYRLRKMEEASRNGTDPYIQRNYDQ
jgi:hypothetical protein